MNFGLFCFRLWLVVFLLAMITARAPSSFAADNSRSDSVDVLNYNLHLNVTDYAGKTISGYCEVSFKSKIDNLSFLDLDLLNLNVDSVIQEGQPRLFDYDETTIRITLGEVMNAGDSSAVIVYYHGMPGQDSGGWGGWYWSGNYSFSISIALTDTPHNYGRSWFPCIDNFVERATYDFAVVTTTDKMALANGTLVSSVDNGNGTITWNWEMLQSIPSYLACIAVNKYVPAYGTYNSITGDTIPILYGAIEADTTKMKNSFINLPAALAIFEESFGPYQWSKVGYCETTVGAMEHATCIAYPNSIINGQTTYESYMAHELSHHWFGNLVTCRTAEDMWLNEGWATFSAFRFFEMAYGKQRYRDEVAANHERCVNYVHTPLGDGAYLTMNDVPQTKTYGETVYNKGADVAHTLRGYMGDSLFFHCLTEYLGDFSFSDASSEDLRDYLSACSGIDLSYFFNDWVMNPGWAAFTIDSVGVEAGQIPGYDVTVFLRQRLNHAPDFYRHVPLDLSFYFEDGTVQRETVMMDGSCSVFFIHLPAKPVFAGLDLDEKISDAVTAGLVTIDSLGVASASFGKMNLNVSSITDTALLRVEHVYAAPDPLSQSIPGFHISQERFWKVDGIWPDDFDASATITYNGTTISGGFLDNMLITNSEDSLRVLYRSSAAADWKIVSDVTQNFQNSHTDKKGSFTITHLRKGEYTFGIYDFDKLDPGVSVPDSCLLLGITTPELQYSGFHVSPNPASQFFMVSNDAITARCQLDIYNLYGVRQFSTIMDSAQQRISVEGWTPGIYILRITDERNNRIAIQKVIVN